MPPVASFAVLAIATIAAQATAPVVRPVPKPAVTPSSAPVRSAPLKRPMTSITVPGPKIVRMPTVAERKLAKCKSDRGKWVVSVKAVEMTASGSDVDELYGSIYISANGAQDYHNTVRLPGGGPNSIWSSKENQNVGKYGARGLSTVTTVKDGYVASFSGGRSTMNDYLQIHFNVYDEDDGRGGSNDEWFVTDTRTPVANAYYIKTPMPSCEEAPEYVREARMNLRARSNGDNSITLRVIVKWSRIYPLDK